MFANIPNILTASRMLFAGLFALAAGLCVREGRTDLAGLLWLAALVGTEELTDMLDGLIARKMGTANAVGGIFDPMADSLSRLTVYFSLALTGCVTIAVPLVMTGRDIIVSYSRVLNAMTGGKTSARFSGKAKAAVQCGGSFILIVLAWQADQMAPDTLALLRGLAAGIIIAATVWSLADYVLGAWRHARNKL